MAKKKQKARKNYPVRSACCKYIIMINVLKKVHNKTHLNPDFYLLQFPLSIIKSVFSGTLFTLYHFLKKYAA